MATVHRARAALNIDRDKTVSVVGRTNAMCVGLDNHAALFPNPTVPTSALKAQVVVVNEAEIVAASRAKGTAKARNVQRNILVGMLEIELVYIQTIADQAATWDQAVAIIEAGGLPVAQIPKQTKDILMVKQGPKSGSVILEGNVGALAGPSRRRFFFNWEYTLDGKTYVTLPSTPSRTTTVHGLTPLTSVGFHVSVTDMNNVTGPWSPTVFFVVH
jgi:hypothetical protein